MTDWLKKALLITMLLTLAGCGRRGASTIAIKADGEDTTRSVMETKPPVAPAEFDVKVWPGGRREITWKDDMAGDYNLDLTIDGKDLFLLAVHFNEESNFNGHTATEEGNDAIDGNRDGELNGLDLFLISSRFDSSISGYRLFTSMTIDGPYDEQFGNDVPLSEEYPFGDYLVEQPDNLIAPLYFKVAAIDEAGETGTMHDYRPLQKAVWSESDAPVIANIDGTDKRDLIPREDFETTLEWWEYVQNPWFYQATNGSVIVLAGVNLVVYETATGEYYDVPSPPGYVPWGGSGYLKISGDGSRFLFSGWNEEDENEFKWFWFSTIDREWGELNNRVPPAYGLDPDWFIDQTPAPERRLIKKYIDTGETIELTSDFHVCYIGHPAMVCEQGLKLSGNGERIMFIAPDTEGAGDFVGYVSTQTGEEHVVFGPTDVGDLIYPHISHDGSRMIFVQERGLFDSTYFLATVEGEQSTVQSFELGQDLDVNCEPTPDFSRVLFVQAVSLGGPDREMEMRTIDGETILSFPFLYDEPLVKVISMMGN